VTILDKRWRLPSASPPTCDAVSVLTVYLVLLFFIPSNLVFGPLGAAGTPAGVLGLVLMAWWAMARQVPGLGAARGFQPVRITIFLFGAAVMAAYAAASVRSTTGAETRAADRWVLVILGLMGVALVAADGIPSFERLEVLLRRVVLASAAIAGLGILQFATGFDIAPYLRIPGLSANHSREFFVPGGFRRVAGTAQHPIEFGVVLATALPVALWIVLDTTWGRRRMWRVAFAAIAVAIPMSLSRSAFLGLSFAGLALFAGWSWKRRRQVAGMLLVYGVVMQVLVPGLLGTIKSLFLNIRDDPSFQGRTQDYAVIGEFIRQRPVFGRGLGTFLPDMYVLLDNQYLGIILEMGFVGLAATLILFLSGIFCARGARRRSTGQSPRQLGQSLVSSILVSMTGFLTFDAFAFPMASGVLFLLIGCCGALWRVVREEAITGEPDTTWAPAAESASA
jgi:polysaccharide biosynthesis protein PslJ